MKFVRTPAILTKAADCLGYPVFSRAQTSVVVLEYVSRLYVLHALDPNVESLGTEPLTLQHRQPELDRKSVV